MAFQVHSGCPTRKGNIAGSRINVHIGTVAGTAVPMITKYNTVLGPGSRCHFSKQVPKRSPEHLPPPSQMLTCPTSHTSPHPGSLFSSIPQGVLGWRQPSLSFPCCSSSHSPKLGGSKGSKRGCSGAGAGGGRFRHRKRPGCPLVLPAPTYGPWGQALPCSQCTGQLSFHCGARKAKTNKQTTRRCPCGLLEGTPAAPWCSCRDSSVGRYVEGSGVKGVTRLY